LVTYFRAPWSNLLLFVSLFATSICVGTAYIVWVALGAVGLETLRWLLALAPLLGIIAAALFTIRGYSVSNSTLLIHRLLWNTQLSLQELRSVQSIPNAMRGGIRGFGNGGFFSFSGQYDNQTLGAYRAFVTDFNRTVVLRFVDRTVVISPDQPNIFVSTISSFTL
jgi:hypothetical protein